MKNLQPAPKFPLPQNAKKVFSGKIFDVYQWQQKIFDGSTTTFERLKRPDTVGVIPVTRGGKILLIREEQPDRPPYISFPGGRVDKGENPKDAIARELLEETGYKSDNINLWYQVEPYNKIVWTMYFYIAKSITKIKEPHLDAGEKIEPFFVTFDELVDLVQQDNFLDKEISLKILKAQVQNKLDAIRKLILE